MEKRIPVSLVEGMERMKKGTMGVADRIPVYAQMSHHAARLAGDSTMDFFSDAEVFLRCELAADEFYGIDAPTIHYDVYNIESEALGATLIWGEKLIPTVDPRHSLLSSVRDFHRLKVPKMGAAGRMPFVLEINRRLSDLGLAPKIRFTGPVSLAANLLGLENLIVSMMREPDQVHRFLRFLIDEIIGPWIVCQRTDCGNQETATGSDAMASPPLLNTAMVREFCLAYIQELERAIGRIRLAGLWGESQVADPEELLDLKREGSVSSIQVLDPDVTALGPAFFRRYADRRGVALIMGIDAYLVGSGSRKEVLDRATWFVDEAGKTGRFVLFINEIPYDSPVENVQAVVTVAHTYRAAQSGHCYVRDVDDCA